MMEGKFALPKLPKWLQTALFLVLLGLIAYALFSSWDEIRSFEWQLNFPRLVLALICYLAFFALRGLVWAEAVRNLGIPLGYGLGLRTYAISYLSRYIPGGVWPFLAIVNLGNELGLSKRMLTLTFGFNIILLLLIDLLYLFPFVYGAFGATWLIILALVYCIALLLLPRLLRLLSYYLQKIKLFPPDAQIENFSSAAKVFRLVIATMLHQSLQLAAYYFFITGIIQIETLSAAYLTLAYATAWLLGFLVLFAPQGLGVRELTFVALSAPFLSQPIAVAFAVALRMLSTVSDLLVLIYMLLGERIAKRFSPKKPA